VMEQLAALFDEDHGSTGADKRRKGR